MLDTLPPAPVVLAPTRPIRVALIADFTAERWPSMDLVADSLVAELGRRCEVSATLIRPPFRRRFARTASRFFELDRLINRFIDYPRHLHSLSREFDLFHIIDHSYAHLVHVLPAARTIVTCHDLETYRCLLSPRQERRSSLFRAMTRRILTGLQRAALVSCVSEATRQALIEREIRSANSCVTIHNGVAQIFTTAPNSADDADAARLLGPADANVELLNVGSDAPRKRLDRLLQIVHGIRRTRPAMRLVRVGGEFSVKQVKLARELELERAITLLPRLSDGVLAAVYRRAALMLMTSEREGFGLPLVEALACGAPVLASAIPALLETGVPAACYEAPETVERWITAANRLIDERANDPSAARARRACGVAHARRFTWEAAAAQTIALYQRLLR